jgi:Zn-dependent protease with chaperone function
MVVTALDETIRVCPQCGFAAGERDHCPGCGTHLATLPELPTRAQWLAERSGTSSPRQAAGRRESGSSPSIRPLLHPTESSRLALAIAAAALTLGWLLLALIGANAANVLPVLLVVVGVVVFFAMTLWFGQQLHRARLLGQSVKVAPDSFPELHDLVEETKATLQYHRRVDVYVRDKPGAPIITTSYLGTRTMVIEGDLVAGLLDDEHRSQLVFLVGRHVGALTAKHLRLTFLVLLLHALDILKFPAPFILPWYRATTYSGDQIGMMCCADADAALQATRRLLVGKDLAAKMDVGQVLPQVRLVRARRLPRFAQLFQAEPHVTNRYANLLCFVRYHDPALWARLKATMQTHESRLLDELWERSPHRKRLARVGG